MNNYNLFYNNFDYDYYRLSTNDLIDLNNDELIEHYFKIGIIENKLYEKYLPQDFDYISYQNINVDLINLNELELKLHYINNGIFENRIYKLDLPNDFDHNIYKKINYDLENLNETELKKHYYKFGKNENRIYNYSEFLNNKINFIDNILWINLDRSNKRKEYMNSLLKDIKIPNNRISAVDGKILDLNSLINCNFEHKMSNYEIACTLSHIKAINYAKKLNGENFMICEDDIAFDNLKYINKSLDNIINNAPSFDILLIYKTYFHNLNNEYEKWIDYLSYNPIDHIGGTVCYIISRKGIEKLCNIVNYDDINNTFKFNTNDKFHVADIYIYQNLETYVYKYNFINTLVEESDIHNEHLQYHINSNNYQLDVIKNDFNII
jgi:GR25 family glycosyltransferase involved in LPS biosynthesis